MFFIVIASATALNAHFCQCLAYFSRVLEKCYKNCAQSNCRIIPKKLRDMKREEICRLLADKVNKMKNKENSLSELLPDVRLLYGETPFARTPVMYEPGIIILFSGHKIGYINERVFRYDANEYLLLTVPLPFECETYATSEMPLAGCVSMSIFCSYRNC